MQLFRDRDITGKPPEPRPSWRDDCSLVLDKEVTSLFSSLIYPVCYLKKDPGSGSLQIISL